MMFLHFSMPPVSTEVASTACSNSEIIEDKIDAKNTKAASAPKGGKVSFSVSKVHGFVFFPYFLGGWRGGVYLGGGGEEKRGRNGSPRVLLTVEPCCCFG